MVTRHTPQANSASYIAVFENQESPIADEGTVDSFTPAEAALLEMYEHVGIRVGRHSIRFGQFCGLIPLRTRVLEILPKVDDESSVGEGRMILLRLLTQSRTIPDKGMSAVGQQVAAAPLLEFFIAAFMREVASLCRGGLLRRYDQREEDIGVVRGRIIMERQFGLHFDRRDVVACRFDELSPNNLWNQILKFTIAISRRWITQPALGRLWIELFAAFEDVAELSVTPETLDRLRFDRQSARYRNAVQWAEWILRALSPTLRAGALAAPGVLLDMSKLFERAIAVMLERDCRHHRVTVRSQDTSRHLATIANSGGIAAIGLRPDIVVRRGERVLAVMDAKWKRLELDGRTSYLLPSVEDMYQLTAYTTAFKCDRLALIYPTHSGLGAGLETILELPPIGDMIPHLKVLLVDVNASPMRFETDLRDFFSFAPAEHQALSGRRVRRTRQPTRERYGTSAMTG